MERIPPNNQKPQTQSTIHFLHIIPHEMNGVRKTRLQQRQRSHPTSNGNNNNNTLFMFLGQNLQCSLPAQGVTENCMCQVTASAMKTLRQVPP